MAKTTTKKTAVKKTAAKKPVTKKATAKKPQTKGLTTKAKTSTKTTTAKKPATAKSSTGKIQMLAKPKSAIKKAPTTRRPPNNPDMPQGTINHLNAMLNDMMSILDNYSQHLRARDRMRLNGVGIRKLGFIERTYDIALENPEFLPHYLTIERFGEDIDYFLAFRSLVDLTTQIREKLWNITIQSADIAYTDALEFYASVREAAKRRVDAAETIFSELSPFFKRTRRTEAEPTEKQLKRDFDSLLHSKKDGKIVIENIKPKLTGGKHKVLDETFKDTARFKETEEGEITE
jgi:hypothetical protein